MTNIVGNLVISCIQEGKGIVLLIGCWGVLARVRFAIRNAQDHATIRFVEFGFWLQAVVVMHLCAPRRHHHGYLALNSHPSPSS